MRNKEFNKLSTTKLITGFRLCAENSNRHFLAATEIAKLNLFGIANSHLILSAEEAIKGLLFYAKLIQPTETIDVEDIFRDHSKKHILAREAYESFKHLLSAMQDTLQTVMQNLNKFVNQEEDTIIKTTIQIVGENVRAKMEATNKRQTKRDRKWWNKANKKKNNGFYLDYEDSKWLLPGYITETEYLESKVFVEKILIPISLMAQFSDKEFNILIHHAKAEVKRHNQKRLPAAKTKK